MRSAPYSQAALQRHKNPDPKTVNPDFDSTNCNMRWAATGNCGAPFTSLRYRTSTGLLMHGLAVF